MTTAVESAELDDLFAVIESMNVPDDFRAEVIQGEIVLNPQRKVHAAIIRHFTRSLEESFGIEANILWDVRVDFPGTLNGYVPDVAYVVEGAEEDEHGRHSYRDVELVAEVVSGSSRRDDYGAKLKVYAQAEIPTYVIADPKTGYIHVHQLPRDGEYTDVLTYSFGTTFDIARPAVTVRTATWPRD